MQENEHTKPEGGKKNSLTRIPYKWIALSNTTLGIFMAALDGSIVLIALPAIFKGIGVNPLAPGETDYLLWTLMGYLVVTATLLVTFGRISDMFGRVRMYNLGFAIFAVGSILLYLVQGTGNAAALQIILFRLVQGVGAAFLFSNSAAILTDAFPPNQRGMAMGINQIAALAGQFIGLIVGGVLASIDWRAVFLVSVPFSVGGTVWAYLALKEVAVIRKNQHLDLVGNLLFAVGLTSPLVGMTYGIQPYRSQPMGWSNPLVLGALGAGVVLLGVFIYIEQRVPEPMFRMDLFKIRMFSMGNIAGFLSSLARGGLNFMLIIWLQGIWLPLHGYSFEATPLWAGIYMLPLTAGFLLAGPLSGYLSDRYGARAFSTGGMLLTALGFVGLMQLPPVFDYPVFAALILLIGIGMGMFAAPNTTAIMNAVPPEHRGASSGMRATFQNTATTLSINLTFIMLILGLASSLPQTLLSGLTQAGVPSTVAQRVANLPPTAALFAAFLGYNPMATLLPPAVLQSMTAAGRSLVLGQQFFPNLIAGPFEVGVHLVFAISTGLSVLASLVSLMRGERYIPELGQVPQTGSKEEERNPGD
jgi:MFS family permease